MKLIFVIIIIPVWIISCVTTDKVTVIKNVSLSQVDENVNAFEQHFNLHDIVPLETNESSLIQRINRLIVNGNKIILLNNHLEVILFDKQTGNYLAKIRRIGNGVGEYTKIMDIALDDILNQIIIHSDNGKILFFDMDCNFIRDFDTGNEIFESFVFDKKYLYFYNSLSTSDNKLIHMFDTGKMKFVNQSGVENVNFSIKLNGVPLVKSKSIWYANPLENYISKIEEDTIIYPYRIIVNNFADKEKMVNLQNNHQEFFKQVNQEKIVYAFTSIKETSNFIYLKSNLNSLIWINKKSNNTQFVNDIKDTRFGFSNLKYFPHDCNDENVLFILQPFDLNKRNPNIDKPIQMTENKVHRLGNLREDANPILLFYAEKKL